MTLESLEAKVADQERKTLAALARLDKAESSFTTRDAVADQISRDMTDVREKLADVQGEEAGPTAKRVSALIQVLVDQLILTPEIAALIRQGLAAPPVAAPTP